MQKCVRHGIVEAYQAQDVHGSDLVHEKAELE
jgi:hypothetical protein